jgi:hypothetical protein
MPPHSPLRAGQRGVVCHGLGESSGIGENQRCSVPAGQVGQLPVDLIPVLNNPAVDLGLSVHKAN